MKTLKLKKARNSQERNQLRTLLKSSGDWDENRDPTVGGWKVTLNDITYYVTIEEEGVLFIRIVGNDYDKEVIRAIMGVTIHHEAVLVTGPNKNLICVELKQSFYTSHKKKILFGVPVLTGIAVAGACYYMAHRMGLAASAEDLKAVAVDLVDTTAE